MKHHRLTWSKKWPAPYESAWSYLVRLCAINWIHPHQLYQLICKDDASRSDNSAILRFDSSEWVDFRKCSELLDIEHERLRHGFLDQIGFPATTNRSLYSGIRHCPICIKAGYHSVFFDLPLINICPWHKVPLLPPCSPCATAARSRGLTSTEIDTPEEFKATIAEYSVCTPCAHIQFDTRDLRSFDIAELKTEDIEQEAARFLLWWKGIDENQGIPPGARETLIANANSSNRHPYKDPILSIIETQHRPSPWAIIAEGIPTEFMRWNQSVKEQPSPSGSMRSSDKTIASIYKAIRRQLLKKYIKKHRRCHNELTHIDDHEALCLQKNVACTAAVSFIAWRLRIETIEAPRALTQARTLGKGFEVMLYPDWSDLNRFTPTLLAHNWYGAFFNIWDAVEQSIQSKRGLKVVRNEYDRAFSNSTNYFEYYSPALNYIGSLHAKIQWTLLPVRGRLISDSSGRCKARQAKREPIVNAHMCDELIRWSWSNDALFRNVRQRQIFYLGRDDTSVGWYRCDYLVL